MNEEGYVWNQNPVLWIDTKSSPPLTLEEIRENTRREIEVQE